MSAHPRKQRSSSRLIASIVLAVSVFVGINADANIRLPDISSATDFALDPAQEYQLGQQILNQVHASLPVIDDTLINSYISGLGSRLVRATSNSLFPFTFLVVDQPQINAFATPGGVIVVHSGLILAAEDESELAAVLAHEIAHVTQRHIARMYSEAGGQNFAAILGMVAAALLASHSAAAAQASLYTGMAASADAQLKFSRENEQEADRAGREILTEAGYDVGAMNRFFRKLLDSTMTDPDQSIEFLQTHPLPQSRIRDSWLTETNGADGIRDSVDYQFFKARISRLATTGGNATRLKNLSAGHYAKALDLYFSKQPVAAMQQLNLLKGPENRYTGLLRAQIKLLEQADDDALEILKALNRRYPTDPAIIEQTAKTLLTQGKPEQALNLLEPYRLTEAAWFPLLLTRAQAEAQSDRQINSHETMAVYYELRGYTTLALEQIQLALQLAPPESVARARLEVQEKNLKQRIRENRNQS